MGLYTEAAPCMDIPGMCTNTVLLELYPVRQGAVPLSPERAQNENAPPLNPHLTAADAGPPCLDYANNLGQDKGECVGRAVVCRDRSPAES